MWTIISIATRNGCIGKLAVNQILLIQDIVLLNQCQQLYLSFNSPFLSFVFLLSMCLYFPLFLSYKSSETFQIFDKCCLFLLFPLLTFSDLFIKSYFPVTQGWHKHQASLEISNMIIIDPWFLFCMWCIGLGK